MTTRTQRQKNHHRGMRAEWLAAVWLLLKAYRLVAWRYKTPVGEIDLVMRRGKALVFIEVKARKTRAEAAAAIHRNNQQRVVRAAQYYLVAHPPRPQTIIRFDAVLITWYSWPRQIIQAFDAGG